MEYREGRKCWNFFDKIYCISLVQRQDRQQSACQEFAAAGLLERVEFVLVEKHGQNPEQGIFESHLLCLEKGLAAGAETILIFEDDILFNGFQEEDLEHACQGLADYPSWDGLFLGCIVTGMGTTSCRALKRISYRCLTHAYAIHRSFAEQLVQIPWQGVPYDGVLKQENEKAASGACFFAVQPMFAFQNAAESDNKTVQIDRLRRLLGGLQRIQQLNSFFHSHKRTIIISHAVIASLLFWLGCWFWLY